MGSSSVCVPVDWPEDWLASMHARPTSAGLSEWNQLVGCSALCEGMEANGIGDDVAVGGGTISSQASLIRGAAVEEWGEELILAIPPPFDQHPANTTGDGRGSSDKLARPVAC